MTDGDETQLSSEPPIGPDDPAPVDKRRLLFLLGGGFVLAVLIGGGLALATGSGGDDPDDRKKVAATTSTSTSSTSTSTSTSTTTTSTTTQPNGGGGGGGNNLPVITSLSASNGSNPSCSPDLGDPSAPFDSPTDPITFTVSWSATNASQTVLSVDGPGAYGTYGTSGSADFTYDCADASHIYKVTAFGPNGEQDGVAEKTITVTINAGP